MAAPGRLERIAAIWDGLIAGESASDIAARTGINWYTVNHWARAHRAGTPWAMPLYDYDCPVCGEHGLGDRMRRVHPACIRERHQLYARQARREGRERSTPYVAEYRENQPSRAARLRYREREQASAAWQALPPDERRSRLDRAHERERQSIEGSRDLATESGTPWSGDDDRVILERLRDPASAVGADLGRTIHSVRSRRMLLLRGRPRLREIRPLIVTRHGHWFWPHDDAAGARNDLWMHTYPTRPLPSAWCQATGCIRPSHASPTR